MQISSRNMGFGVLILLGLILAFIPANKAQTTHISSQDLLSQLQNNNIYVQADELADWIINKKPGYQLVDIRSQKDYDSFHIQNNIHIPLSKLNATETADLLDDNKMIVLASNGNTLAGQAWLLLKQMGYTDVYILAGGVNHWVKVLNNPQKPAGVYTDDELFTYQFHKAAGAALMGNGAVVQEQQTEQTIKPKPVVRIRKKKSKKVDEGC